MDGPVSCTGMPSWSIPTRESNAWEEEAVVSDFIVYSVPGSTYGRAVLAAILEKDATYRLVLLAPRDLRSELHVSRHPFGRVPVVEHQGFMLYETQAILRYVDRVGPGKPLTPRDVRAAALMDQIMNINDWYLFQGVIGTIGFQRIIAPRLLGQPTDESVVTAALPKAHKVFDVLSRLLGDQPYFVGEALTLADLIVAPQMDLLSGTPEWGPLTEGKANLVAWLDRMNSRASFRETTWERLAEAV